MKENSIILKIFKKIIRIIDEKLPNVFFKIRVRISRFICDLLLGQKVSKRKISDYENNKNHVFFGYYDISPFDIVCRRVLAMHAPLIERSPRKGDFARIGFYELNDPEKKFNPIGETDTWCWQQGCRLQWYGNGKNQIIYNCLVNGEYGAEIRDVETKKTIKKIHKPLYCVSPDGRWGLSLDFSRLQRLRPGYGYGILAEKNQNNKRPSNSGVVLVNIENDESKMIISLDEITKISPHKNMKNAEHYFNHLMISPSGEKFLFYHLWNYENKKYSRLFVAENNGKNIILLNNSGKVSHYNWISDDEIILYSYIKNIEKLTYAIYNSIDGRIKYFGRNVPKGDGHPTYIKNKDGFITDTYPDLCFRRNLILYDVNNDTSIVLARFNDSKLFLNEFRCDLHPRINNNYQFICVDRIKYFKRILSIIPLNI